MFETAPHNPVLGNVNHATVFLTAFIRATPDLDDLDRVIGMAAYMSKRLELDMKKTVGQLELELWSTNSPEETSPVDTTSENGESGETHEHNNI